MGMGDVKAGDLPQLLGGLNEEGEYIVSSTVCDTLRNIRKQLTDIPNQIVPTAFRLYESVPRLDEKAFRYLAKGDKMFLMESVDSMGGLSTETVLTDLGDLTKGSELNPDFTEIIQIKTAKKRQREQQLKENERIAARFVKSYNGIADHSADPATNAVAAEIKRELQETKRFVRLGKPDYYQAQMEIIAKNGGNSPELKKICDKYQNSIDRKNLKWATAGLKFDKSPVNAAERVGLDAPETIGKLDPKRRADFVKYYKIKSPKIEPYLTSDEELVDAEMTDSPFVVVDAQTQQETANELEQNVQPDKSLDEIVGGETKEKQEEQKQMQEQIQEQMTAQLMEQQKNQGGQEQNETL